MPKSGSYFYPGLNNNITAGVYNEVIFKTISGSVTRPDAIASHAALFVSGTGADQNLYYQNDSGTLFILGNTISGSFEGATNFYIDNAFDLRGYISSSTNTKLDFSSSIDFLNSDKDYHLNARNNDLILSSSATSIVYISGNLTVEGNVSFSDGNIVGGTGSDNYLTYWKDGNEVTGSANLLVGASISSIYAANNHLILSSSAGSNVYVSSSLDLEGGAINYKWRKLIDTTDYVTNPISTSSFTVVAGTPGANIIAGMPLKWSQNSTTYYGICTDVTSTTITIAGPALTAAVDFDNVWYGREEDIDIVEMFIPDTWADVADDDLLKNDVSTEFRVKKAQSYLVYASVRSESVSGQSEVNIANADGAENVFYTDFTGSTGINESVVNIDLDNYLFTRNEKVFLRCLETGSLNGAGNDNLTVSLTFVTP
jgi:hypothetical protein